MNSVTNDVKISMTEFMDDPVSVLLEDLFFISLSLFFNINEENKFLIDFIK